MTTTAVIVDTATGVIKRKITGDPTMFAVQAGSGETVFALTDYDGRAIDDANLVISEAGEWEAAAGAPEWLTLPTTTIELVAP